MPKILGTSHLLSAGGWGGGAVTFSCAVQKFLRPHNPTGKKNLDPPRFMTKNFVIPPIVNTPAPKHNPLFLL